VTEKLVTRDARMATYQMANLGYEVTQFEMLKRLELGYDAFRTIKAYADRRRYLFFSTPDEEDSADFLDQLGVPLFKIGSGEVTNLPLLRHVAKKGKPIILSTGMSALADVEEAVRTLRESGNDTFALLHCVSSYPADPSECNLKAIDTMFSAFGCPVGFSDHTLGIQVAIAAVARGACIIEKHLTLDKTMPGPDHKASLDPPEFAELVRAIRATEAALGNGVKRVAPSEFATRAVVQKVIVAARAIKAGTPIEQGDLCLRRAASGLPASHLAYFIGRRLNCDLAAGDVVSTGFLT
jgi:N,N'-diacetyllegionaminate synthase